MKLHASGEDYLETILVLQKKLGMVRSVDVARHMEVSKPLSLIHILNSVSNGLCAVPFKAKCFDNPQALNVLQHGRHKGLLRVLAHRA